MKKIFTLIALFACVGMIAAQETVLSSSNTPQQVLIQPQHFGYLSYNDVLHAMPQYQQAMKSLEELKKTYDQEMERSEKDFSKKFTEYLDGQKTFPENIMLKRQKELQQLMEQSLTFKQEAQQLLDKAEKELMQPVHQKLKEALYKIGTERGYDYILNTDNNSYPFVNSQTGEDITAEAISVVSK